MRGTFDLVDTTSVVSDGSGGCEGTDGFDDIREGAGVTVYDASNDVVATGSLGDSEGGSGTFCTFQIAVDDVPKNSKFYKVEVSHRGTVQLTAEEAESGQLSTSLG